MLANEDGSARSRSQLEPRIALFTAIRTYCVVVKVCGFRSGAGFGPVSQRVAMRYQQA